MTTFAQSAGSSLIDIPDLPDRSRMYRECGARLRDTMRQKGVDALVLLGNGNVVYSTGISWPLLDAGLSHVERPVAIAPVAIDCKVLIESCRPRETAPSRSKLVRSTIEKSWSGKASPIAQAGFDDPLRDIEGMSLSLGTKS